MTIELSKEEFAYLLAAVEASSVIGVEDPKLFPSGAKSRETTFRKGREQLEANGWITALEDHDDEHEFNADLYQLVAVVGEAEYVLGTSVGSTKKNRKWMLHYLVGEHVVELWATQDKSYALSVVPDREGMVQHVAEVLGLETTIAAATFMVDEKSFEQIVSHASKGEAEQAAELAGINGKVGSSLTEALANKSTAELWLIQGQHGEVAAGRHATVYGTGTDGWMVWRQAQGAPEMRLETSDSDSIARLISDWIEQFTSQIEPS